MSYPISCVMVSGKILPGERCEIENLNILCEEHGHMRNKDGSHQVVNTISSQPEDVVSNGCCGLSEEQCKILDYCSNLFEILRSRKYCSVKRNLHDVKWDADNETIPSKSTIMLLRNEPGVQKQWRHVADTTTVDKYLRALGSGSGDSKFNYDAISNVEIPHFNIEVKTSIEIIGSLKKQQMSNSGVEESHREINANLKQQSHKVTVRDVGIQVSLNYSNICLEMNSKHAGDAPNRWLSTKNSNKGTKDNSEHIDNWTPPVDTKAKKYVHLGDPSKPLYPFKNSPLILGYPTNYGSLPFHGEHARSTSRQFIDEFPMHSNIHSVPCMYSGKCQQFPSMFDKCSQACASKNEALTSSSECNKSNVLVSACVNNAGSKNSPENGKIEMQEKPQKTNPVMICEKLPPNLPSERQVSKVSIESLVPGQDTSVVVYPQNLSQCSTCARDLIANGDFEDELFPKGLKGNLETDVNSLEVSCQNNLSNVNCIWEDSEKASMISDFATDVRVCRILPPSRIPVFISQIRKINRDDLLKPYEPRPVAASLTKCTGKQINTRGRLASKIPQLSPIKGKK